MNLQQRFGLFSWQQLTMLEDKLVRRIDGMGQSNEDAFQYLECAENPTRIRRIGWAWFIVGGLMLALAALFGVWALQATRRDADSFYMMAVVWAVIGLLIVYGAVRRTFHVIVFVTPRGGIVIRHDRPTADACREFVRTLQQKIADSRSIEKRTIRATLRTLHQEEFLDEWKYQKAQERFGVIGDKQTEQL